MPVRELDTEKSILSPQEVREILGTDNKEIVKLCKKASIVPQKDENGQTYFSSEEVRKLQTAKCTTALTTLGSNEVIENLLFSLKTMEQNITQSVSTTIDEKLDGMDEVVVELIRCKTENETLRQKLNELNKENYHLKSSLKCYKNIGLGLYIRKENDDFSL